MAPSADDPTVRTKLVLVLVLAMPSDTLTRIVLVPDLARVGVILSDRFELVPLKVISWDVTMAGLDESATRVKFAIGVSMSPMVKETAMFWFLGTIWSGMLEIVGGSFTGFTVNRKLLLADKAPSLTVSVIVDVPDWLGAGAIVIVRFELLPPRTMAPVGINSAFEVLAETARLLEEVSASPIVNGIGEVAVSSSVT